MPDGSARRRRADDLVDQAFVAEHTTGVEPVLDVLAGVDVAACARECGVPEELLRSAARRLATAGSAATFEDLGSSSPRPARWCPT